MAGETEDLTGYWNARLDRIEALIERVREVQGEMNTTLAVQANSLEEHMRRTELLEEGQLKVEAALVPLKAHVAFWGFLGKVLAGLTALGSLVLAAVKLLDALR